MDPQAIPYCGSPTGPGELWSHWNFDPFVLAGLLAIFLAGRLLGAKMVPLGGGIAILTIVFISPLCALTSSLFSARGAHHVVLTGMAAPLLAMALPRTKSRVASWTVVHAAIFWAWHAPSAYAYALGSDAGYWLMQATLLGSAVGFWQAVRAATAPVAIAAVLANMIQMGLLGALLTFSARPLYAWHWATTQPWGMTPLMDQQLAGLIMWVGGGALFLAIALRLGDKWLRGESRLAHA